MPFPVLVDPTRRMLSENLKVYDEFDLVMHHFSYVRNNLKMKLENSSANVNWNEEMMNKVLEHFDKWETGMDALMAPATVSKTKQVEPKFSLK